MKKILSFALLLIAGGMVGFFGAKFLLPAKEAGAEPMLPEGSGLYLLLAIPFLYFVVVGVHELGHVLAGKFNDFEFYGLTIGPFSWKSKDGGGIRFAWNRSLNLAGGLAIMLPRGDHQLRRRFLWFAAGGPLASLALCLIGVLLAYVFPEGSLMRILCFALGAFSAVIFVATILPFRAGGFASDGLRIVTFARNGPTAAADLAALRALTHVRAGRPHAELPAEEFAAVSANPAIPAQQRVTMDYYRYLQALGVGDIPLAEQLLGSVMDRLDEYPPGSHGNFYLEQALFAARYQQNLEAAEAALARYAPSPFTEALSLPLTRAAIADLRGDTDALQAELPDIEAALPKSMDKWRATVVRQWLADWKCKTMA